MDDFIKFSEFQKLVSLTPIKTWRTFDKLRHGKALKEGIDWKSEDGSLYVVPSRLFVEAKKLRPEIQYVNDGNVKSNDFKMNSNEISSGENDKEKIIEKENRISDNANSESDFKRNQMNSNEIVKLLKSQIEELKKDKSYFKEQARGKAGETQHLHKERVLLMREWQKLVGENDALRRQITDGEVEVSGESDEPETGETDSQTPSQTSQNERDETYISSREKDTTRKKKSPTGRF